jgi:hypothetical protein
MKKKRTNKMEQMESKATNNLISVFVFVREAKHIMCFLGTIQHSTAAAAITASKCRCAGEGVTVLQETSLVRGTPRWCRR